MLYHEYVCMSSGLQHEEWAIALRQNGQLIAAGPCHIRYIDGDADQGLSREQAMLINSAIGGAEAALTRVWYPQAPDKVKQRITNQAAVDICCNCTLHQPA